MLGNSATGAGKPHIAFKTAFSSASIKNGGLAQIAIIISVIFTVLKFWATVLNGLRNRGVEDIFIAWAVLPKKLYSPTFD